MYALRIIALVGVIGAGQNVSNTSLRNSGEGVSYAHGWIEVDRRSRRGGEPSIIGEIITPGGLARRFDSQWDNGVKTMRELKETRRLPRLELKLNFADRRPSSVSRDNAAVDCAFELASSFPQPQQRRDRLRLPSGFDRAEGAKSRAAHLSQR